MGPYTTLFRSLHKLVNTLTEIFKYTIVRKTENEVVLQSIKDDVFSEIIAIHQEGERERPGRGSIHHLAIRAKNEEELRHWEKQIKTRGFAATKEIGRASCRERVGIQA